MNPGQAGSGCNSSDAWDYFHINSVDKNAGRDYLISARDACANHKINGTDGEIIWVSPHLRLQYHQIIKLTTSRAQRLNGKESDLETKNGTKFRFQHHARWLE